MTKFTPAPGIVICEITEQESSGLSLVSSPSNRSRLLSGRVTAVGDDIRTDFGATLEMRRYARVGDTVVFLSYEGSYDFFVHGSKRFYMVKIQDIRSTFEEENDQN